MGKNDIDSRNLIINDGLVDHVVINQSARSLIFCVIPLVKQACIHKYVLVTYVAWYVLELVCTTTFGLRLEIKVGQLFRREK